MCTNENEDKQLYDENFNQKFLVNDGVRLYFSNVFDQTVTGKLPMIKYKLRKVLVDFGLVQTCIEVDQKLDFIKVWYRDEQAVELKELFVPLRRDNKTKNSQAIELVINLEGNSCSPPKIFREIRTYTGLTKLLFQEFIQLTKSRSLVDDDPYNQMEKIIKQGNLSPTLPLQAILAEGVD